MRALFVLLVLTVAAPLQAAGIDLEKGHDVAFYTKLRLDFAAQKDSNPNWTIEPDRQAVVTAFKAGDVEKTIQLGRAWLDKTPVDADVYLMLATCMKEKGDVKAYCQYIAPYYGLLQSITAAGDGKTVETAFKVIAVPEEYSLLREIGAKLKRQSLIGHCDRMETTRPGGKEDTFYFDVSISLAATAKALGVKPPPDSK